MASNESPIRTARIRLGLSRDELGRILGVSGRAVSYWESGKKSPDRAKTAAIRDVLQLSEVDLWRALHRKPVKVQMRRVLPW